VNPRRGEEIKDDLLVFFLADDKDVEWYPRQKVRNARKKLEGFNPAYVLRFA